MRSSAVVVVTLATILCANAAHAATFHWAQPPVSGRFDDAANWAELAVPGANDTAIVDVPNGGVVYVVDLGPSKSIGALTIASADAEVLVQGSNANGQVTIAVGVVDVQAGELHFESKDQGFASSINAGSIAVEAAGTLRTVTGSGGARTISGSLQNDGLVDLQADTLLSTTNGVYENRGTLRTSGVLTIVGASQTLRLTSGLVDITGARGFVDVADAALDFEGGAINGQPRVRGSVSALTIGALSTGAGSFLVGGNTTIAGDVHAAQSVLVQGNGTTNQTTIVAVTDVHVFGTLTMQSADQGFSSRLDLGAHKLTIESGGHLVVDVGSGGDRVIFGDVENDGTVDVTFPMTLPTFAATVTNNGTWNVDAPVEMNGTSQHLVLSGGALVVNSAFTTDACAVTMTGGVVSGRPVLRGTSSLVVDAAANGAASFLLGGSAFLGGTIHALQDVLIQGNSATNQTNITASSDVVVDGTLTLKSADQGFESDLDLAGHTLSIGSTGHVVVEVGSGGDRSVFGNVDNDGTVDVVGTALNLRTTGAQYVNTGAWNVNANASLAAFGGGETFALEGGTLTVDGFMNVDNGTFAMTGGSVVGRPVLRASTLFIAPGAAAGGSAAFLVGGSSHMNATIHAGQDVLIQGDNFVNQTTAVADADVLVDGLLTFQSADQGFVSRLDLNGHTLAVSSTGHVDVENGSGGDRFIFGSIVNDGVIDVNGIALQLPNNGATYVNTGAWNVTSSLSITGGAETFTLANGALTVAANALMNVDNGTFAMTGGTVAGRPVIRASSLVIDAAAGGGASFLIGGGSQFAGTIHAGQDVLLQGNNFVNQTTVAANSDVVVDGTLTLRSADQGFVSRLDLAGHALRVGSTGHVVVDVGSGGDRFIFGSIRNAGTIDVTGIPLNLPNANVLYDNAAGAQWNIGAGASLAVTGGGERFSNEGTLAANGFMNVDNGFFDVNGGTVAGTPFIRASSLTFDPAATGAASFVIGSSSHLAGTIHAAQSVLVQGNSFMNQTTVTAAGPVVVEGTLTMRSADQGFVSRLDLVGLPLVVAPGGLLDVELGSGGDRQIFGGFDNEGTVEVNGITLTLPNANVTYLNNGTFTATAPVSVSGGNETFTLAGGSLDVEPGGAFTMQNGTFAMTGGSLTGTGGALAGTGAPLLIGNTLAIDPAATGRATFVTGNSGALTGVVHAGQTVVVQGNNTTNQTTVNVAALTVQGTLLMRSADQGFVSRINCINGSGTAVSGAGPGGAGLLVDTTGVVRAEGGSGGDRIVFGDVDNKGRIELDFATQFTSGTLTNDTTGVIAGNATFTSTAGFVDEGTFAPGPDASLGFGSHGALNASVSTGALPISGLAVRLGGTQAGAQFDQLVVGGTGGATVSGPLVVTVDAGFVPNLGDAFPIVVTPGATLTGLPNAFTGLDVGGGIELEVVPSSSALTLVALRAPFRLTAQPSSPNADAPFDLVIDAIDIANGNVDTSFVGSVTLSSTDPFAQLISGPIAFSAGDAGSHVVTGLVLRSAGPSSLTATDVAVPSRSGTAHLVVGVASGGTPPRLVVTGVVDGSFTNAPPVNFTASITSDDPLVTSATTFTFDGGTLDPAGDARSVSSEGAHTIAMNASDIAGRTAAASVHFTIDTTPPTIVVAGVTSGEISTSPLLITVNVNDASFASSTITLDGAPFASGALVGADGDHVLVVTALDRAGNSSSTTIPFTVDANAPQIAFTGFTNGALLPAAVRPGFTVSDATSTTVTALLDGKAFVPNTLVGDGAHVLDVVAVDEAGHRVEAIGTFTVDATPPQVSVLGVSDGGSFPSGVSAVVSVVELHPQTLVVTLDGATYVDGTPINVAGAHVLSVLAVDQAGHSTDVVVHFTVAPNVPALSLGGVVDGTTYTSAVTPVVTCSDANATLVVKLDNVLYDGAPVSSDGKHFLDATCTNTQGGVGRLDISFTIDSTPPSVVVTGVVDGGVYSSAVTPNVVAGNDAAGVSATLDGADFPLGTPVSSPGVHTLTIVVRDQAGNQTRLTVTFTIDPNAPTLTLGGVVDGAFVNHSVSITATATPPASSPSATPVVVVDVDGAPYTIGTAIDVEGPHVVHATATIDLGGGASSTAVAGLTFTVDETSPQVSVRGLSDGAVVRGPVALSFTVSDAFLSAVAATLDGVSLSTTPGTNADGTPNATGSATPVDEGPHVFSVIADDSATNETSVTTSFSIDNTPPTVAIVFPPDGSTQPAPVTPIVDVTDANLGSTVVAVDGVVLAANASVSAPGVHVLDVKAVDLAGNVTEVTSSFTIIGSTAPHIVVTRFGEPAAGDVVTLFRDDGARVDGARASVGGNGVVAPLIPVPPGNYRARVDHIWQRFFTDVFAMPGGDVHFDIPDEPAYDATFYVDANATDGGDGSFTTPFRTLKPALDAAAGSVNVEVKLAGGSIALLDGAAGSDAIIVPPHVVVRGGHRPGSWAFEPASEVTTLHANVEVGDDGALLDVTVDGAGVVVEADGLVRDVIVLNAPQDALVTTSGTGALMANVLVDGATNGVHVDVAADGFANLVSLQNITVAGASASGFVVDGDVEATRLVGVENATSVTGAHANSVANGVVTDGVVFVKGPLHDRYLAQRRGGQKQNSAGVDAGDVDTVTLDLRGRTTATNGAPDVGNADFGFHAWPVAAPPPAQPKPQPEPPSSCASTSTGTASALWLVLAALCLVIRKSALLSRRRHRRDVAAIGAVVVCATSGCSYHFDRSKNLQPGDIAGRTIHADGGGFGSFARITAGGANVVRHAGEDGNFVVHGLGAGSWLLNFAEDQNGDGKIDRVAVRAVSLTSFTAPGDSASQLSSVLLGDIPLAGVVEVTGVVARADQNDPSPQTRAFVVRSATDLSPDELAGVDAASLNADTGAVAQTGIAADAQGHFSLAGVPPGTFRLVAFDPGDDVRGPAMSPPSSITAAAGGTTDVGTITMAPVTGTRHVAMSTALALPAADGLHATVTLVKAGGNRDRDVVTTLDATLSSSLALEAPFGAFDVYVDAAADAPEFHGVLLGALSYPAPPDVVLWGPMSIGAADPCNPTGANVDRDGDGLVSLPPLSDAPELWAQCTGPCSLTGAALATAHCDVGGVKYDCDDDGDGDPDVLEPSCVGLCAGVDLDQNGACDDTQAVVTACTPSCAPPPDAGPADAGDVVVDAGTDAGVDAGIVARHGCTQAEALPPAGVVTGTLASDGADDVDGCFALHAADAIFVLHAPGQLATLNASLAGSTFDTTLSVFDDVACDASGGATTSDVVGCNDDSGGPTSVVRGVDVPAGDVYFVVEGFSGAVGDYRLEVDGTYALGAACDPALTTLTCPGGACGPDGNGGFACLPPRDCPDGVDADGDGTVDEDTCSNPPTVTCPADTFENVLSPIALHASAVDDVAVVSRRWSIVTAPTGASEALSGATTDDATFTPLLVGTYRVRYVAADDFGQLSACEVNIDSRTTDGLRVELLWNLGVSGNDPTDLDLHLLHPTSPDWFDQTLDCHFANCREHSLSWNFQSAAVDPSPSLDVDDRDGRGPENIDVTNPESITYRIGVHYFADNGFGPSTAQVNVFCFGALIATVGPQTLTTSSTDAEQNDFWKVADVDFADAGCTVTPLDTVVTTANAKLVR